MKGTECHVGNVILGYVSQLHYNIGQDHVKVSHQRTTNSISKYRHVAQYTIRKTKTQRRTRTDKEL